MPHPYTYVAMDDDTKVLLVHADHTPVVVKVTNMGFEFEPVRYSPEHELTDAEKAQVLDALFVAGQAQRTLEERARYHILHDDLIRRFGWN